MGGQNGIRRKRAVVSRSTMQLFVLAVAVAVAVVLGWRWYWDGDGDGDGHGDGGLCVLTSRPGVVSSSCGVKLWTSLQARTHACAYFLHTC